jgi:sphingomyelin phosphodiesterase
VNRLYDSLKADSKPRKTFKAAHYSDVHVDHSYKEGTKANCNMPLCCREENGIPADPKDAARKYGDYNCDTAPIVLQMMFEYIRDEIKPEVLFWTGDMSPHNVWENSHEEVAEVNYVVAKQMQEIFGESLMIYPLQGNHDVFPVNVQSFSPSNPNPVIKNLTTVWDYWLNEQAI